MPPNFSGRKTPFSGLTKGGPYSESNDTLIICGIEFTISKDMDPRKDKGNKNIWSIDPMNWNSQEQIQNFINKLREAGLIEDYDDD